MSRLQSGTLKTFFAVMLLVLMGSSSFATNGYFRHGYGIQYRGLAGAGAALYLSPLGIAVNPASAVFLKGQFDLGVSLFNPNRQYTISGAPSGYPGTFPLTPGVIESESNLFLIPNIGVSIPFGKNNALAFALYGNGGMNTDYATKTFDNPQLSFDAITGVDLSQMFIMATVSREIVPNQAIGVSAIFGYQRFQAEGLYAFSGMSADPTNLTNNGYDNATGFGIRVGYLGQITQKLSMGLSYQSKMNMSKFDKYCGLFAGEGDFDIPSNWTAGLAFRATEKLTLAFDVQEIYYSDVNAVSNPMVLPMLANGSMNPEFEALGGENASGFGWEDIMVFKFGAQMAITDFTTLRAGYSYSGQPVPETEAMFNILAPGVVQHHATMGISHKLTKSFTLNAALMRAFSNSVSGVNPMEAPEQQQIELQMNQWEGDLGISLNF